MPYNDRIPVRDTFFQIERERKLSGPTHRKLSATGYSICVASRIKDHSIVMGSITFNPHI